jgi:hypothetical protein
MNKLSVNNYCSDETFDIIYEFIGIDSNIEKDYNKFKYECDLLKNELYTKNNIINNLNEKIIELNNTNNLLLTNNQNLKNENENENDNLKNMPHFVLKPPLVNTEQKKNKNRRCIDIFTLLNIYTTK